jgi:ribosomal-protein-alanine N-acetyltransferase
MDQSEIPEPDASIVIMLMIRIAPMTTADLDAVMDIELASHLEPWSSKAFMEELVQPCSRILTARVPAGLFNNPSRIPSNIIVDESRTEGEPSEGERIIGYICIWLVADEAQILNIAVHCKWRGRGIGRALLSCALRHARERESRIAVLEVRPSNTSALRLYESLGFRTVGIRPNYYAGNKEPAILMELNLDDRGRQQQDTELNSSHSRGITQ